MELVFFRSQATRKQNFKPRKLLKTKFVPMGSSVVCSWRPANPSKRSTDLFTTTMCSKYASRGLHVHDNVLLIQELGEDDVHYTPPGVWPARLGLSSSTYSYRSVNTVVFASLNLVSNNGSPKTPTFQFGFSVFPHKYTLGQTLGCKRKSLFLFFTVCEILNKTNNQNINIY